MGRQVAKGRNGGRGRRERSCLQVVIANEYYESCRQAKYCERVVRSRVRRAVEWAVVRVVLCRVTAQHVLCKCKAYFGACHAVGKLMSRVW